MRLTCVDAGFLIALYDTRDRYHARADAYFEQQFDRTPNRLVVPWPILYETVSTRMARNKESLSLLKRDWERLVREQRLERIDDCNYREMAIEECFIEVEKERGHYRSLSLVDRIIRNVLLDDQLHIDAFVTFNEGDFFDVCTRCICVVP